MHISISIKGYYEWLPVPKGTPVTEDDQKSLRVKAGQDGQWLMRVPLKVGDVKPDERHHDLGIPEAQILDRLATMAKLGRDETREEFVAHHVRQVTQHHLHRTHMIKFTVVDDGPDVDAFKELMDQRGVAADHQELALSAYAGGADIEAYLNASFNTDHHKQLQKGGK